MALVGTNVGDAVVVFDRKPLFFIIGNNACHIFLGCLIAFETLMSQEMCQFYPSLIINREFLFYCPVS